MKIAVAQTRPRPGPVEQNLAGHQSLIKLAAELNADLIVFPELSLTGYEPRLAADLAKTPADPCFQILQTLSDSRRIEIGVGVPTIGNQKPRISLLLFKPGCDVEVYSKHFLHDDEVPFFEANLQPNELIHRDPNVSLAICYELSVDSHLEIAHELQATIYIASVAKNYSGMRQAKQRLEHVSQANSMITMLANCLGKLDGEECIGQSSVWCPKGKHLFQLDSEKEGIIVLDTDSKLVQSSVLPTRS